jgi:two-component system, OmpR family, sensor histidine kinase QseC
LRTPLAVLRAQSDVVRGAGSPAERALAESRLDAGFERIDRLVAQLLALSRLEASSALPQTVEVAWPPIVEDVMSSCLGTAEARGIELSCDWPADGRPALPLQGDPPLLGVMLRNLMDNAVHYAPPHSAVSLRFEADRLVVENGGAPLPPEQLARMGERFYRPPGQSHAGSGLGVSIAQRVAALHGLVLVFGALDDGQGVRVEVRRAPTPARVG